MSDSDFPRAYKAINACLAKIPADDLIGLIGPYFDLAGRDPFFAAATMSLFLSGNTIAKLKAARRPAHADEEREQERYYVVQRAFRETDQPPRDRDVLMALVRRHADLDDAGLFAAAKAWALEDLAHEARELEQRIAEMERAKGRPA